MSIATTSRITPEELLKLPDGERYELVDGELVEGVMSFESVWIATLLSLKLNEFVLPRGLGFVAGDGLGYQCFDESDKIRRPDVSFVRAGRLSLSQFESGHCQIAPDLAVEVVSPNDLFSDVERKANEYLTAGVKLVWVLNPETQTILVYRPDGTMAHLSAKDDLDGETVLPGFQCPVRSLFPDKVQLGLKPT